MAYTTYAEQKALFDKLMASLLPENTYKWKKAVVAWEKDPFNMDDSYVVISQGTPAPFSSISFDLHPTGITEAKTLCTLTCEEQKASVAPGFIVLHEVSVVGFITMGLELEDAQ